MINYCGQFLKRSIKLSFIKNSSMSKPVSKVQRPKTGKRSQESQWALGWEKSENMTLKENSSFMKYHNSSHFVLQDKYSADYDNKKVQMKKHKTEEFNSKLPTYDPRGANKSHIVFGNEKGDFSSKPSGITSPRMPPGGRSQIIFG